MNAKVKNSRAIRVIWSVGGAVVFAIIIVALSFKVFGGRSFPKNIACEANLIGLATQIELFGQEQGRYPTLEEGLEISAYQPSESAGLLRWRKYIWSVPLDPWGAAVSVRLCRAAQSANFRPILARARWCLKRR